MVLKGKLIVFILLLFIVLYFAQGAFYTSGTIISQLALLLILGLSGIYFLKATFQTNRKRFFFIAWTSLLTLNIIGFILTGRVSNAYHFSMFKGVLISLLTFYPFYYYAQKDILKAKHLLIFFFVMLIISIYQFYYNREQIILNRRSYTEDVVNNAAYIFVNLIPFVFLLKRHKILSATTMLVLLFFIIQGAKRGALITGSAGLIFFLYYQIRIVERKHIIRSYLLSIAGMAVLIYFAFNFYLENEFISQRMSLLSEGGVSGRDRIYLNILNQWFNSDKIVNLLFGYGFGGSMKLSGSGHFAHNDWLELLSNFGLFGVFIYMMLFYAAYKNIRRPNLNPNIKILMLTVVTIWFFISLFSMGYTSNDGYLRAIILGYLIGNKSNTLEN